MRGRARTAAAAVANRRDLVRLSRRPGRLAALGAVALAGAALAGCGSSSTSASSSVPPRLVSIGAGLHGQPGLHATVYARGVPNVAAFAFDSQGRLWAAAAGLTGHRRDGVYLIARPGDHPVRVIGGLKDPLGLVWRDGQLYVSSRHDEAVYKVAPNGTMSTYAEGMGIATGIAFDAAENLYVGDRSGTSPRWGASASTATFGAGISRTPEH